jgi:tRNA nucleotidyltransferase/poly(A) polymerase
MIRRKVTRRSAALLADVSRLARRSGIAVYLVGGAVRDGLLRKTVKDFDLAVADGEEGLARSLQSRGWGRAFPLTPPGASFPVWRVAGGELVADVARLERGDAIEDDLARRDFTVNAMARDLPRGRLIDPFGGKADLRRGVIRAVSEKNFTDDPLRVLRAYRLAATHGWKIAPATRALLRRHGRALSRTAPERVHEELVRWLRCPRPGEALCLAARDGVLAEAFGLARRRAWKAAARAVLALEGVRGRRDILADRLALLFHGLRLTLRRAAGVLLSRKFSREESRSVARRMEFLRAAFSGRPLLRTLFAFREELPQFLGLLAAAASGPEEKRRALEARRAAARVRRGAAPVDGHDLRRWLSLEEGPRLGRLLEEASYRYFTGQWASRAEIRRRLCARRPIDAARPVR